MLNLANRSGLDLPLDFITERIAILARPGAGKSGAMRVLAEEISAAGQRFVFIDPKGDAWGVRAAGTGPGLPVLILGGERADVPLEPTGGAFVAELIHGQQISAVVDVSDFDRADMVRFVTKFALRLYALNRDPLHVLIDEIDEVAGEKFYDPHCLNAIQKLQNKGRRRGFGLTIASQRSAVVNKTVLNASGTLIAMQTTAPRDLDAIKSWLEVSAGKAAAVEIVAQLPKLKTREAIVYSPQLLPDPKRITFRAFRTFDSMETPKVGEIRRKPKSLADLDLTAIRAGMAETIERAKADDPEELRKEIAGLKRQLAAKKPADDPQLIVRNTVAVRDKQWLEQIRGWRGNVETALNEILKSMDGIGFTPPPADAPPLGQHNGKAAAGIDFVATVGAGRSKRSAPATDAPSGPPAALPLTRMAVQAMQADNRNLPPGERKILLAIAQNGDRGATRQQLTAVSGYKKSSRDAYVSRLLNRGLIVLEADGRITANENGFDALGDFEPLPTGPALADYWLERLPPGESAVFAAVLNGASERDEISTRTNYKKSSRDAYISRLSARQLIDVSGGAIRPAAILL